MKVYLDHSATTAIDKEVLNEMLPYFSEKFGNASSAHSLGQEAASAIAKSRNSIASHLNCDKSEIIFTSGATESNNIAIFGLTHNLNKYHFITTNIEHPAVLMPFACLEKQGHEVSILKVGHNGLIDPQLIEKCIRAETRLVSAMYVNSEIGSINDIKRIGDTIRKINKQRPVRDRIYFHCDATQALNFISINVEELKVDLLSFSGHKIYGPKGVGVLYVRKNTPIHAISFGGSQEANIRSGTLNVPGIVGIGKAVEQLDFDSISKNNEKIQKLRTYLFEKLKEISPTLILNTDFAVSTPSHLNIVFPALSSEMLLAALDLRGIQVSIASACSSKKNSPSHVLMAIGRNIEEARSSIRFTLGKHNSIEDIDYTLQHIKNII